MSTIFHLYSLEIESRKNVSQLIPLSGGVITRVLLWKYWARIVLSHVRSCTEKYFLFNQYFTNFLGQFRCRNLFNQKNNPYPTLIQNISVESTSILFTGLPYFGCNVRSNFYWRNVCLPFQLSPINYEGGGLISAHFQGEYGQEVWPQVGPPQTNVSEFSD